MGLLLFSPLPFHRPMSRAIAMYVTYLFSCRHYFLYSSFIILLLPVDSLEDRFPTEYVGQNSRVPLFAAAHNLGARSSSSLCAVSSLFENRPCRFNSPRTGVHLLCRVFSARAYPHGCVSAQTPWTGDGSNTPRTVRLFCQLY